MTASVKKMYKKDLQEFRKEFTEYMKDKAITEYDSELISTILDNCGITKNKRRKV